MRNYHNHKTYTFIVLYKTILGIYLKSEEINSKQRPTDATLYTLYTEEERTLEYFNSLQVRREHKLVKRGI